MQHVKPILMLMLLWAGYGALLGAAERTHVVLDERNHIYWQDTVDSKESSEDQDDAMVYCQRLELDGLVDWRLPTFRELLSIVDFRRIKPAILPLFDHTNEGTYWSATTFSATASRAWTIDFRTGLTYYSYKHTNHAVRCVKDVVKEQK